MPPPPPDNAELERQRARIEALFRDGWIPKGPDRPRTPARQFTGHGSRRRVAFLFCHQSFPGVRFGRRSTPADKHAPTWLMEEIETGALHRMMRTHPPPDDAGTVWTTWGANENI